MCDIGQMVTPPKSKSPWEAMTAGSTGGAFNWANNPWVRTGATLVGGAINPFLGAALGASQSYPGYKKPWGEQLGKTALGAGMGYMGGKGMQGLAKGGFQSAYNMFGNLGKGAGAGVMGMFGPKGTPSIGQGSPLTQAGGTLKAPTAWGSVTPSAQTGAGALTYPEAGSISGATGTTGAATAGKGINWGTVAKGAGTAALGTMFRGPSRIPESQYMGDYTSKLLGGTEMNRMLSKQTQDMLNRPEPQFNPLSDEMYETAVRRNKEEEERAEAALRTEWKGVRSGADIESDAAFRKDLMKMREKFRNERMALNNELAFNRENEYLTRLDSYYGQKMDYLTNTLQLDQNTIQQYAQLAQMDIERLMNQFGLEKGEAARFQEIFGDLGSQMMTKGLNMGYDDYFSRIFGTTGRA